MGRGALARVLAPGDAVEDHPAAVREADAAAVDELVRDSDHGDHARVDRRRERSDDADAADPQRRGPHRPPDPHLHLCAPVVFPLLLADLAHDPAARSEVRGSLMDLEAFLRENGITAARHAHPPVMTVEESERLVPKLPGAKTKNLFLRDKKGARHFLVTVRHDLAVDLDALGSVLDARNLGFASPERLMKHLSVTPRSVS